MAVMGWGRGPGTRSLYEIPSRVANLPALVAGPGAGKTRTLTHRIAYLVSETGVDPSSVLAVLISP